MKNMKTVTIFVVFCVEVALSVLIIFTTIKLSSPPKVNRNPSTFYLKDNNSRQIEIIVNNFNRNNSHGDLSKFSNSFTSISFTKSDKFKEQ